MKPKSIKADELTKIFSSLKKGEESSIGSYLIKGIRLQISKFNLSGAERVQLLYKRRRTQGLCIVCGTKVTKSNQKEPVHGQIVQTMRNSQKQNR